MERDLEPICGSGFSEGVDWMSTIPNVDFPQPADPLRGKHLRREVFVWRCSDDCSCSQVVVDDVFENLACAGWIRCNRIYEGTYHCEADADEIRVEKRELRKAARLYGWTHLYNWDGKLVAERSLEIGIKTPI